MFSMFNAGFSRMEKSAPARYRVCSAFPFTPMLSLNRPHFLKTHFDEVAIADFGAFQMAVPTVVKPAELTLSPQILKHSQREYSREGWVICRDRSVGTLSALEIAPVAAPDSVFQPIRRFGPAIPVAFEVYSHQPLPVAMTREAQFSCHWDHGKTPFCTVFRQISPRFTRVYTVPNWRRFRVVGRVKQLLIDEAQFIAQHRDHLQQVPFYRQRFGL